MARQLSERTRQKILDAALGLMLERDFAEVSSREIAAQAGVAETTVFRYFPKKEAILTTIVDERGQEFFGEVDWILQVIERPIDQVLAVARKNFLFKFHNRDLLWVIEREMTFQRPSTEELFGNFRSFLTKYEGLVRSAIEVGELREGLDPRLVALQLLSISRTLVVQERLEGREITDEGEFLRRADILTGMLLDGIRTTPETPR